MKKLRFLAVCALLVGTVSGCTLLYPNWGKPTDSPSPTESNTPDPTNTDTASPTPTPTNKGIAEVEIMDAYVDTANGILQVVAQVTNFSQDGGKCTATFNGGGKTVSVTGTAESNAANTQCRPIEISLTGLPKGAGVVTVTYDSDTKHGVSSSTAVNIQ
jgi:hypothetical protein